MKHIVWAVMAASFIFTATAGYSRGFSVGVFGAYSIDGGNIEDSIIEKRSQETHPNAPYITKSEYDTVMIPGAGAFVTYLFSNGIFIRAGAEYYELISGNEVSKSVWDTALATMINYDYEIDYQAIAWPVFIGFSLSPDKGRTSLYMAAGVISSLVKISRETSQSNFSNFYNSENETVITGFAGLVGIEKRLLGDISVMIEYTFYKCEKDIKESGERYQGVAPMGEYQYTENYGLPRQQARIGVKYSF